MVKEILKYLVLPVASGLIVHIIKAYFVDFITGTILFSHQPCIAGSYRVEFPDDPVNMEIVVIKQVGTKISGEITNAAGKKYKAYGNVSSRWITYRFYPQDKKMNDFGVGFLKLSQDGNSATGYVLFLSEDSEIPSPRKVTIKRTL